MNTIYRIVWNAATGKWVVASELAKGRKKSRKALVSALAVALAASAPFGAAFAAGSGTTCTTSDGQSGTLNSAGICEADSVITPLDASLPSSPGIAIGNGGTVTTGNANDIAIGNVATGSSADAAYPAIAIGYGATANNLNTVALGTGAQATNGGAIAIGSSANASGYEAIALYGTASGTSAVSIGTGSKAAADYSAAFGSGAIANTSGAIAIGAYSALPSSATGTDAIAIGTKATTNADFSIAIGSAAAASGQGAVAMGNGALATETNGTAVGIAAKASGVNSAAFGPSAIANGDYSVAIGSGANVTASNAVALGAGSVADTANTISVGNSTTQNKIVNMGAGTISATSTDAVNGSQLYGTANSVATALGGNSTVNADGSITAPTYTVGGTPVTGVGAAITNIDGRVTQNTSDISDLADQIGSGTVGLVQQTAAGANLTVGANTDGAVVDFTGTAGTRTLTGVTAGNVAAGSTDAVNGSQLFATNENVATNTANIATNTANIATNTNNIATNTANIATNTANIATNTSDINNLADQIGSGTVGLVQQATAGANLTVGANTDGSTVDFTGTAGARTLTGVANGNVSATSLDAVNGSQLYGVSSSVASALGGGSTVNADGSISAPSYTVGGTTVNSIGGAISNIDGRVTQNSSDISDLNDQISSGTVGLVQQNPTTGNLTVGANTGGASVDFTGTAGPRVLTGVANGTGDTDAATIAQLKAMGLFDPNSNLPLAAVVYDGVDLSSVTFGGSNGTLLNNVAPGLIASGSMQAVNGGQLFDLQQNFQSQFSLLTGQYNSLNDRVGTIEQSIADGSIGGPVPSPGPGSGSTQVGDGANASGTNSTAVGTNAVASGDNSTATGAGSQATGSNSTANGAGAVASGSNSTATGANSVASGSNSTANGANASATGTNSTALGANSSATGNNSVALGAGSVADRDNTVSVGSPGNERQITNVAAGTQRTDAANWGQVQDAVNGVQDWANQKFTQMNKRINGMGAMSAAYGQMAFSAQGIDKPNRMGVGVGMQNGQSAIAVGYSRQIKPNLNVSFGGSASANDVSVGAGMAFGW